jgi:hypothetical protein
MQHVLRHVLKQEALAAVVDDPADDAESRERSGGRTARARTQEIQSNQA